MNQKEELIQIMLEIQNYLRHNNVNINAEEIYDSFRDYGLSEKEKNQPIPEAAKNDIRNILMRKADEGKCHYSGNPIDDISWNPFRTNYPNDGRNPDFQWKVYIPIKMEGYGFAARSIISFLCDNGIVSASKISGRMRSDSLVVNLTDENDVVKLCKYINDCRPIKDSLGAHHPFIPDCNGIGVIHGQDIKSSYTERLSSYLTLYVDTCREQNRLDYINANDFLHNLKVAMKTGNVKKPDEIQQIIDNMDIILNDKQIIDFNINQK